MTKKTKRRRRLASVAIGLGQSATVEATVELERAARACAASGKVMCETDKDYQVPTVVSVVQNPESGHTKRHRTFHTTKTPPQERRALHATTIPPQERRARHEGAIKRAPGTRKRPSLTRHDGRPSRNVGGALTMRDFPHRRALGPRPPPEIVLAAASAPLETTDR